MPHSDVSERCDREVAIVIVGFGAADAAVEQPIGLDETRL